MSFERLDGKKLLEIVHDMDTHVTMFHNAFTKTCLKDLRKGQYRASVLLRDYRIVEVKEFIPDFNPDITLAKLQQFITAWYPITLSFCVSIPVRAPIDPQHFNNYLVISCETSFFGKGKVFRIHGDSVDAPVSEVNNDSNEVLTATAILSDTAIRPYLNLFHFAIAYN